MVCKCAEKTQNNPSKMYWSSEKDLMNCGVPENMSATIRVSREVELKNEHKQKDMDADDDDCQKKKLK